MENLRHNVGQVFDRFGDEEGRGVTLDQIRDLLVTKYQNFSLEVQDPQARQEMEAGGELLRESGIHFSWQEELELLRQAAVKLEDVGTYDVNYILAPRINSMGRLKHGIESLRLLCLIPLLEFSFLHLL